MMKLRNALVILGLVSVFAAPAAMAGPAFSVYGVGNYGMPSATVLGTAATYSSTIGYGGGAAVTIPFSPAVGLNIGVNYVLEKATTGGVDQSFGTIDVPVTLRFMLGRYFFLDAGGYLWDPISDVTAGGVDQGSFTTALPGATALNFGLVGGLGAHIPMGSSVSFMLEGAYHFQLTNALSSLTALDSTASLKFNELQVYAGLTFGGGSRN